MKHGGPYDEEEHIHNEDEDQDLDTNSDSEEEPVIHKYNPRRVKAVRKTAKKPVVINDDTMVIYTTDGLSEYDYRKSNVRDEKLVRSECCYNYFKSDGYEHKKKFGLDVPGLNVCIHCYFCFNIHKYGNPPLTELNENETKCLQYYIKKYTPEHKTNGCAKNMHYGKCLLCEAKAQLVAEAEQQKALESNALNTTNTSNVSNNENTKCNINDVMQIKKTPSDFVLIL